MLAWETRSPIREEAGCGRHHKALSTESQIQKDSHPLCSLQAESEKTTAREVEEKQPFHKREGLRGRAEYKPGTWRQM